MKKIEEHIYKLLFTQDCVIVPNFGGFIGQYNTSKFNEKTNLFVPPSKTSSFNKHLTNDDGLLTHDIANTQKISYSAASDTIKQYVLELKAELQTNNRVEIKKVGTLYLDQNKILKFIAAETNFSTKHFGFPVVKPILKEEIKIEDVPEILVESKPIEKIEETPIIPINSERKNKKSNGWWAAAVLIPIIFYSAWIPLKTDLISNSKQFHYSDLNPFTFQKLKTYRQRNISKVSFDNIEVSNQYSDEIQKVKLDESTYLWVDNRITVQAAERETTFVETKNVELVEEIKLSTKYHLIGGCFGDKENAENLVTQLQELGYSAKIIDKNKGLHRVSVGEYSKRKTAKKAKALLKSEQEISSWILKK